VQEAEEDEQPVRGTKKDELMKGGERQSHGQQSEKAQEEEQERTLSTWNEKRGMSANRRDEEKGAKFAVNNAAYGILRTLDGSEAAFDGPLAVERKQAVRVRKEGTAGKRGENAPLTGGNEVLDGALSNGGAVEIARQLSWREFEARVGPYSS
jgi:hypothetical protein